jgi:hypothetical protein
MKFNRGLFWRVFATLCIIETCFFLTGCTSAWLTAVSGLLPGILSIVNAIVSFVAALENKTVSSATYATIQKWAQNVQTEIANAQTILASIKQAATSGLLAQFQAAMQAITTSFNSILAGVDITDSSTVAKLTQFLALGVAAVNAVLALIPMAIAKLEAKASDEELKHYDGVAAKATTNAVKLMKETYVAIIDEPTTNADVNAALATLPKTLA